LGLLPVEAISEGKCSTWVVLFIHLRKGWGQGWEEAIIENLGLARREL